MRLTEYIIPECVSVNMKAQNKKEAIKFLVNLLIEGGAVDKSNEEDIIKVLEDREKLSSTGVGYGIAIPHGRTSLVDRIIVAIAVSPEGVDFESLDGKLVHIFFLLLGPDRLEGEHLKALARMARFSKDRDFRKKLLGCKSPQEIIDAIKEQENKEVR